MVVAASGTYSFTPAYSDFVIDAFSRCQIRPAALTANHMQDAQRSLSLLLAEWTVKKPVINLFTVQLNSIVLVNGQPNYAVPNNVVEILDYYVRSFQFNAAQNVAPLFQTTLNSTTVTGTLANNGFTPNSWFSVSVPVAIGGIVLSGFYQVVTVPTNNTFTFVAGSAATSNAGPGGTVPLFTTVGGSANVTVTLTNHGYYAGQQFTVGIATTVGGIPLSGPYSVVSVTDANIFVITAVSPAASTATGYENGGLVQILPPSSTALPQDRVMLPISRTEYSSQPTKTQQAFPTTVWWDRTLAGQLYVWPNPQITSSPLVLYYYCMTQIQDASIAGGQTPAIPLSFYEALVSGLAFKLAVKYPPPNPNQTMLLRELAEESWREAADQNSENVPLFITPAFDSMYRN